MSDLISREALLEEIKENRWGWFSREMLLLMLENQPSVTDTNVGNKWIPCSERIPEPFVKVLIFTDGGTFDVAHRGCSYLDNYDIWRPVGGGYRKKENVIAWMPLPEPYKGE